jgi:hypothetical protein
VAGTYAQIKPTDPRVTAFRAAVALMQGSPLCRLVKVWKAWTGDDDSATDPTLDQLPCVRITPYSGRAERRAGGSMSQRTQTYSLPLRIEVEVWVPGARIDDLVNLWGRVEAALLGEDDVGRVRSINALAAANVKDALLIRPAFPEGPMGYGAEDLVGVGEVQLEVWFNL